jgi:hypothetical protein
MLRDARTKSGRALTVTLFLAFKSTNAAQTVQPIPGLKQGLGRIRARCGHH